MNIRSMYLDNFRCFKNLDIAFDDRLTVLVGANGSGKTAILDALILFLKWAWHYRSNKGSACYINSSDITIGYKPEDVKYHLQVLSKVDPYNGVAQIDCVFDNGGRGIFLSKNQMVFKAIEKVVTNKSAVFAAYMAGRFVSEKDFILTDNNHNSFTFDDYGNSFARTIDYASTLSWFDKADADEARTMRDNGKKDELPELKAVREALSKALLGKYVRPRMQGNPPELIIYEKDTGEPYKVGQLSDGYRAMLALVMDLARRMAQSRSDDYGTFVSLLTTPAIVLIDEIELHLHPSWQQTVLTTLMDIFPNTQFIVTTHSPQVLTSIPPRHIRILNDGEAYTYSEQTEGAEASRLLKRVFGVEQRPANLEIVEALKEYRELVYSEQWGTPKAEELKKKLADHYSSDDPELMELELHIENRKWESGL